MMTTLKNLLGAALSSTLLVAVMPAQASPVYFTFDDLNGVDLSFVIDSDVAPTSFFSGISTSFDGIEAVSGGSSLVGFPIFYSSDAFGGFNGFGFNLPGPQLYAAGTEAAPVFLTGTYRLMGFFGDANLTISAGPPSSTVPEPGSLLLMALALAGLGLAGKGRKT